MNRFHRVTTGAADIDVDEIRLDSLHYIAFQIVRRKRNIATEIGIAPGMEAIARGLTFKGIKQTQFYLWFGPAHL